MCQQELFLINAYLKSLEYITMVPCFYIHLHGNMNIAVKETMEFTSLFFYSSITTNWFYFISSILRLTCLPISAPLLYSAIYFPNNVLKTSSSHFPPCYWFFPPHRGAGDSVVYIYISRGGWSTQQSQTKQISRPVNRKPLNKRHATHVYSRGIELWIRRGEDINAHVMPQRWGIVDTRIRILGRVDWWGRKGEGKVKE